MFQFRICLIVLVAVGCQNAKEREPVRNDVLKDNFQVLTDKIREADSVILIRHGSVGFNDTLYRSQLVIENKPNEKIIQQRQLLSALSRDSLIKILQIADQPDPYMTATCFDPHHSIFIYKDEKLSYVDICFSCGGTETSKDLESLKMFSEAQMIKMFQFFESRGMVSKNFESIFDY